MKNLKIRVNNEAEAEEVKRLAVKAGYKLDALFGKKWSAEFCYLLLCEDMSAGFSNEIMADGDKPLSIGELRAMVNPMKEYLEKQKDGTYSLVLRGDLCKESDILIPEGAVKFLFSKENGSNYHFANQNNQLMSLNDIISNSGYWYGNAKDYMAMCKVYVLWQREQDEPFLTPECTLNDQYAEIEEVRRVEIHGTVKAKPDLNFGAAEASGGVDATLSQRQSQYGCYEDVAHVTQQILSALRIGNYDKLPAPMKESLHMIASKMARIVNGDPEYLDNWHDIGGYAKLIEKLIKGE